MGPSVPLTRPPISELFSTIRESNVIESTCDYSSDPLKHHNAPLELNDAKSNIVCPSLVNIDIDTADASHRGSTVRQGTQPIDKSVDPRVKRLKNPKIIKSKEESSKKWLEVERYRV